MRAGGPVSWLSVATVSSSSPPLVAMTTASSNLTQRELAIKAAERRLQWLEIETRRMKAELARLAADCDDDVADSLTLEFERESAPDIEPIGKQGTFFHSQVDAVQFTPTSAGENQESAAAFIDPAAPDLAFAATVADDEDEYTAVKWSKNDIQSADETSAELDDRKRNKNWLHAIYARAKVTPLVCSFTFHSAVILLLLFGVTCTVAKFEKTALTLTTAPISVDDDIPVPAGDLGVEQAQFVAADAPAVMNVGDSFNASDIVTGEFSAAQDDGAGSLLHSAGGQLDVLPTDLGTLITGTGKSGLGEPGTGLPGSGGSGTGKSGSGKRGGGGSGGGSGPNSTIFFGTKSKGNRFVFVIDNSSSMKGGRLDMARAELLRTVENLSPKQSFYVIFVADQTYPMFFPRPELDMLPATGANIKHLAAWLPNAMLASGKNRELIKAMDMAASLRPDAVYLLWDGDLKYSESVRTAVMTHLTAPNQWNFTVHTIGFNITSLDSEQNLTAIAQAHSGAYRRIDLPAARTK